MGIGWTSGPNRRARAMPRGKIRLGLWRELLMMEVPSHWGFGVFDGLQTRPVSWVWKPNMQGEIQLDEGDVNSSTKRKSWRFASSVSGSASVVRGRGRRINGTTR